MTGQEISRWADAAMYRSEPLRAADGPRVILLNATFDPLGSLAALCALYEGRVIRSLNDVIDDDRRAALDAMLKTELNGALESIQFHFLIEGVTRAWTHQAVRERYAFVVQESMRFAVVEGQPWSERVAYPPSLAREPEPYPSWAGLEDNKKSYILTRDAWDDAVLNAEKAYAYLIEKGIPAEDARGLIPHAMTTRLHMVLSLRTLIHLAGLRLCTQAQFEWRSVMAQVVLALRKYGETQGYKIALTGPKAGGEVWADANWQFQLIADTLQPVCYQQGRCGFMAQFDRGCTIRDRVEANARADRPSSEWHQALVRDHSSGNYTDPDALLIPAIRPEEWAADPAAARRR